MPQSTIPNPFTEEGAKRASQIAGQSLAPVDASKLGAAPTFNVPAYTAPTSPATTPPPPIDFGVDTKQAAVDSTLGEIKTTADLQGQEAVRRVALEGAYKVPEINKQLQEYYAQDAQYQADLTNLASRTLQSQVRSEDRLAPTFTIQGEQAQASRQSIFQEQNINIKRATNSALISAGQGRLALAQDYIQRALDSEFKPLESKIAYLKTVLDVNRDSLSKAETAQLEQRITENQRSHDEQKTQKADIYSVMLTAQKFGADAVTLQKVASAKSREEAVQLAGQYLQDPKAKFELEALRLDNVLAQAQIAKIRADTAQVGQPTATERKAAEEAEQQRTTAFSVAKDTLRIATDLRTLVQSGKGNSIVGGSRVINWGAAVPGSSAASVQALFDQLKDSLAMGNIDKLKGAMSDKDIEFLRNVGTNLRLNLSESAFSAELDRIIARMDEKMLVNAFSADEQAALDQFFSTDSVLSMPMSTPASYYSN